jgi:UDP-N-acetylmuramate: L-alanyl-gamma-D-glutamyl-meso-diaminopimelate ligase
MRELWNTQMWPLFLFPRCGKIKQLEEVSYDQIAQAFNRKDLIIYTNPKTSKTICLI